MSDEHKGRRKLFVICLLALFIALIGIVLPEQDIAFETIENNTDLSMYGTGERLPDVTYYANNSEIQILLLGTATTDDDISMNLSVGGVVVQSEHLMDLPLSNPPRNISISMNIPKGSSYMVTNHSRTHVTWREYPILTGKNGTLSINMTGGGTGSQNLSQVLDQGNQAIDQRINYTNAGKWLQVGYNNQTGLMEINTSSIFYYKQGSTYLGFTGLGYAYSAYDNKPMKFGQSGTNYSQIAYNNTYGTTWNGEGTAANRLNITGFDKVNMYQDTDYNDNNISKVYNIAMNITNGSYNTFTMLGSSSTPFFTAYENGTMRHEMTLGGTQIWRLRGADSSPAEVGYIVYSTPASKPGIALFNASLGYRATFAADNPGALISASSTGGANTNGLHVGFDNNITVDGLAGTGNAYACLDANGKLYRGNPTC